MSLQTFQNDDFSHSYKIKEALEMYDKYGFTVLFGVKKEDRKPILETYFGKLISQYGHEDYPVQPSSEFYSANSHRLLFPHTDRNEFENIKIAVSLYVEHADRNLKGLTTVCNMENFIFNILSEKERDILLKHIFFITPNNNLKTLGVEKVFYAGPLLTINDNGDWSFRFSANFTHTESDDKFFINLKYKVLEYYEKHRWALHLPEGSLLIFKNHQCLHGRSDIQDMSRKLIRNYMILHEDMK